MVSGGGSLCTVVCRFCGWPVERCLERKTGWKHVTPWNSPDKRCGGKAEAIAGEAR